MLFVVLHTAPFALLGIGMWIAAFLSYRYVPTGAGIIALILLAGSLIPLGMATYRFLWWRAEEYMVTNFRILQVEGILSKRSLDSSLGRINDVEMKQSMFGRMFDYGDIYILTGSSQAINDLLGIDQPFQFKSALLEAKTQFEGLTPGRSQSAQFQQPRQVANVVEDRRPGWNGNAPQESMDDTSRIDSAGRVIAALSELRNAGVITEAEYQEKLQKLMNN